MRFRRQQRRPGSRGQWFPTVQGVTDTILSTSAAGSEVSSMQPLIASGYDDPPNDVTLAGATAAQLANVLRGNSYLVKRIVGSVFVRTATTTTSAIKAAIGVVVAEQQMTGGAQATENARFTFFSEQGAQQRWLWRRTWLLGPSATGLPISNIGYGSVREGTHMDSKVMARVGYGEQLFLIYAVLGTGVAGGGASITFNHHLRMFGKSVFYPPRT